MNREELLDEARSTVKGEREDTYGGPEDSFATIAQYWNVHLEKRFGKQINVQPCDVAVMMALLKMARLGANPGHPDSWLDIAGYAACGAEVSEGM